MKPAQPKHFLLVDDHPIVTAGLQRWLGLDFPQAIFYTATNGNVALEILAKHPIDILTLDVSMPEMDGYEAFPLIKKSYPDVRIILLTQYNDKPLIQHFIQLKASAILFKRNTTELAQAIQAVWDTGHYISDEVRRSLEYPYDAWGASLPLTERARNLIKHIAAGESSREIAGVMGLTENTVNSYRQDLLKQTQTKNTDELIAFTFKNGLLPESA